MVLLIEKRTLAHCVIAIPLTCMPGKLKVEAGVEWVSGWNPEIQINAGPGIKELTRGVRPEANTNLIPILA